MEKSGKGFITSLGINNIRRSNKIKKARFAITNVSIKDPFKITNESEDLPYEGYVRKSSKHMPTDSYFYLSKSAFKVYYDIKYECFPY